MILSPKTFLPLRSWPAVLAVAGILLAGVLPLPVGAADAPRSSFATVVDQVQPKIVKIFGSGGLRGLESYQSGFLISAEGHILTVWSYVLDSEDFIHVVLNDGQRFDAQLLNHDPRLELALLKIDAKDLSHFDLEQAVSLTPGARVLAFSNLFGIAVGDEAASVLHGHVAALSQLAARRGAFQTLYRGPVYILDAMTNNPGAAGGALTDRQGRLAGLIGKELRNSLDNTWLNYAIPLAEMRDSITSMLAGRAPPKRDDATAIKPPNPHSLKSLGILLIPDILPKTPPFVDHVRRATRAAAAGLRPDDLILFVNDHIVSSCKELAEELSFVDHIDPVRLTVQRGGELIDIEIEAK